MMLSLVIPGKIKSLNYGVIISVLLPGPLKTKNIFEAPTYIISSP